MLARLGGGAFLCMWLGVAVGGCEVLLHGWLLTQPLGVGDWIALSAAAILSDALLGGLVGLLAGLAVRRRESADEVVAAARQVGIGAVLLGWFFLGQAASTAWGEGRPIAALVLLAMPIGLAGVVYFNARAWLRRAESAGSMPFAIAAAVLASVLAGVAPIVQAGNVSTASTATGLGVVLVTIDGLPHDASSPTLSDFAAAGVTFSDAVTPTPSSRPAHASILVGLHPLRHRVLRDDQRLSRGYETLFERLGGEGFAPAGFVSDARLSAGAGFEQGFVVYDDGFRPAWARANVVAALGVGRVDRRDAAATVDAFERWLALRTDGPIAAWIHLDAADPGLEAALLRISSALSSTGHLASSVIGVVGTYGATGPGLGERSVRVPMVFRTGEAALVPVVTAQVRLIDVAPTLLDFARRPALDESEGIALGAYGTGIRKAPVSCTLVGTDAAGAPMIGLRNNGAKFLWHEDDRDELYRLDRDPGETQDLSETATETVEQIRALLGPERAALARLGAR